MNLQKLTTKYRELIRERMSKYEVGTAHDARSHFYTLEGQTYPSVTAKLQILKDQGLMNWKMNRALSVVEDFCQRYSGIVLKPEDMRLMLDKAREAPQLEFEGAGSIGTTVHDWKDSVFKSLIDGKDWEYASAIMMSEPEPAVISGCRAISAFIHDTGYIPLASELRLASHKLKLGGSLDDIGILPNPVKVTVDDPVLGVGYKTVYKPKLVLIDLKTSNIGDKTSYFLQVALYYEMFRKMTGIKLQQFYILHASKVDGTYKLIEIKNMYQRIKDAKLVLKLNDALDQIDKDKKKVPIIL